MFFGKNGLQKTANEPSKSFPASSEIIVGRNLFRFRSWDQFRAFFRARFFTKQGAINQPRKALPIVFGPPLGVFHLFRRQGNCREIKKTLAESQHTRSQFSHSLNEPISRAFSIQLLSLNSRAQFFSPRDVSQENSENFILKTNKVYANDCGQSLLFAFGDRRSHGSLKELNPLDRES